MELSREQKRIAKRIVRIGRKRGESRREIKAALETGLVESNLRNLSYGDADSAGWRQERASLYSNPTNVKASVNRFYDETSAVEGQYSNAGDLAAAVQRPAAQYRGRYQERAGEADQILRQLGGMSGRRGRSGPGQKRNLNASPSTPPSYGAPSFETTPGVDNAGLRQSLLQGYLADRGKPDALLGLASGLKDAQDVAATTTLVPGERKPGRTPRAAKPKGGRGGKRGLQPVTGGKGDIIGTPYAGTHSLGNWQSDNAIDVAVPNGSPIRVPRDAVVEKVGGSYGDGSSRFDGFQVTVRLKSGNRLFFTHLSKANVKAGQKLGAGAVIGRSGSANGVPHLHMGAEKGNPQKFYGK